MSATSAALRIARRDAWRNKGRSALVVALIALPVLAVSAAAVLARTAELDPQDVVDRRLGAQADAAVELAFGPILQAPNGWEWSGADGAQPGPPVTPALGALLPGSRLLPFGQADVRVRTTAGLGRASVEELDYADPLAAGLVKQVSGRAPRTTDEVAVTADLQRRTGAQVGQALELTSPVRTVTVVGVVEPTSPLHAADAYALPGAVRDEPHRQFLVDAPQPLLWDDVLRLNAAGVAVTSRPVVLDPPPRSEVPYYAQSSGGGMGAEEVTFVAVAAGMALLEVVLLAGPAFAVGARRARRSLALVAAVGGTARHVRAVVLAQGVVLGVAAGAVGVAGGIALAAAAAPVMRSRFDADLGRFDVRPLELALVAAVGVVTAVLAAVLPARSAARQDVVAALAGRRGEVRTPRRVPVIGVLVVLVGGGLAVLGAARRSPVLILVGAATAQLGFVTCSPSLVGLVGRAARHLPLAPRLALRDAARARGRTAPAVSAVMAAVAGSVAAGIFVASQAAYDEAGYTPSLPHGSAWVDLTAGPDGTPTADVVAPVVAAVEATLPVAATVPVRGVPWAQDVDDPNVSVEALLPPAERCPLERLDRPSSQEERRASQDDPRCAGWFGTSERSVVVITGTPVVDDGTALEAWAGRDLPEAREVLRRGGAVVFSERYLESGKALLRVDTYVSTTQQSSSREVRVAAVSVAARVDGDVAHQLAGVVLGPRLAERLGVPAAPVGVFVATTRMPTTAEEEAAAAALASTPAETSLRVERGYDDNYGPGLLALVLASAIVVVGATAVTTGLAMTDAAPDLATLAAVGAAPRLRRRLSMSSSLVVSGLGTALGTVAGVVPVAAVIWALQHPEGAPPGTDSQWDLVLPWPSLAATALGVPLLAAAAAGLLTRSRLPVSRRVAA